GRRVFGQLVHPALRHLRISGFDALASLGTGDGIHTNVASIDLGFHCHLATTHETVPAAALAALLPARRFPAVTMLDLSRCEPGHLDPINLGGSVDVLELVAQHPLRRQLTSLRLPTMKKEATARLN